MLLKDIVQLLDAEVLTHSIDLNRHIESVHASDLISEVLATCARGALWITGLLDPQIINTAELFDLACVIFVGNRRPSKEILEAAEEDDIPLLMTEYTMFETCGRLYQRGLKSATRC